ncbi:IclR family transcriptional regulator [Embleya hyalina]|uniref:IclR family transcriptional regulator n=1 Tax=Embleya hyalina TaxID=516124 RepID=A0A401YEV4_9ACTN|nr:IclR family transcriptional regulator [Embleya hyalina]GCD93132.1 IclR family transcriptional regulator [Embleya hyalina]
MSVKPLQSVRRALEVLEAVAEHQPVGVGELSRLLDTDKSAVQRALVTLHAVGWIRPAGGGPTAWELSSRPLVLAGLARRPSDLAARARPILEELARATGETATLALPDAGLIIAVDVVESSHQLRAAPRLGSVLPPGGSAAGIALFSAMDADEIARYGVDPHDPVLAAAMARTRERGWSLNAGAVTTQITTVGAVVLDDLGRAAAALVISAPTGRLTPDRQETAGALVAAATRLGNHHDRRP